MVGEATDNNVVTISGKVTTELKYSHEIYGEGFYQFILEVPRLSDSSDNISVTISERLIGKRDLTPGSLVNIEGQFRSYNSFGENGSKLLLTVFAREISYSEDESQIRNSNKIFLNGFICKKPVYRSTPFGREITDLLIAVNRAYNKSDYIPCISWGRNARLCSTLNVGDNIKIWGRIQSRTYQKKMPDGSSMSRVAYEVSLSKLENADAKRPGEDLIIDDDTGREVMEVAAAAAAEENADRLREEQNIPGSPHDNPDGAPNRRQYGSVPGDIREGLDISAKHLENGFSVAGALNEAVIDTETGTGAGVNAEIKTGAGVNAEVKTGANAGAGAGAEAARQDEAFTENAAQSDATAAYEIPTSFIS